jgi:hypothetical protein
MTCQENERRDGWRGREGIVAGERWKVKAERGRDTRRREERERHEKERREGDR